jgi:prepilin-type N-terminal cleavage/methylation domain-containing protein
VEQIVTRARTHGGYTLVEVLVAMVILGLVLPGLTIMIVSSRKAVTANFRMDQAYSYGQLVLDSVSILPSYKVQSSTSTTTIAGTTYSAALSKSTAADGSDRVVVGVSWLQANKTHTVYLREVLRRDGLYR